MEVLLRSGANPGEPNGKGLLAVELAKDPFVRDLFLRDRSSIFSPVVQARSLFAEYVASYESTKGTEPSPRRSLNGEIVAAPSKGDDVVEVSSPPPPLMSSRPSKSEVTFYSPVSDAVAAASRGPSTPGIVYNFNLNRKYFESPSLFSPEPSRGGHGGSAPAGLGTEESRELREAVVEAAAETALAWQLSSEEFQRRYELVRQIQDKKLAALRLSLEREPSLASCRLLREMANELVDGFTPVHLAAQCDNVEVLQLLFEIGTNTSAWTRDMQGRTALHIAAMHNAASAAKWLRDRMRSESKLPKVTANDPERHDGIGSHGAEAAVGHAPSTDADFDPVGERAPVDLAGLTPLGCAKLASSKKRAKPMSTEVRAVLFSPGDRSVLPRTPRAGKSPAPRLLRLTSSMPNLHVPSPATTAWRQQSTPMATPFEDAGHVGYSVDGGDLAAPSLAAADSGGGVLVFAVAEAQGWTSGMEDRAFSFSPLTAHPAVGSSRGAYPPLPSHLPARDANLAPSGPPNWLTWSVFGVLDGHGGSYSSDVLSRVLPEVLVELALQRSDEVEDRADAISLLLTETFRLADRRLAQDKRMEVTTHPRSGRLSSLDTSGSTGLVLLVTPSLLCVANAGDCRCVLARTEGEGWVAQALSVDHKPSLPAERRRIEAAQATAAPVPGNADVWEIAVPNFEGNKLRVSRAFGDFCFKQFRPEEAAEGDAAETLWRRQPVTALPEVTCTPRDAKGDRFLLLACDGVWDVMSNEDAVLFIAAKLRLSSDGAPSPPCGLAEAAEACDALLAECLSRGSRDNMTVWLVLFQGPSAPLTGSGRSRSVSPRLPTSRGGSRQSSPRASFVQAHTRYLPPTGDEAPGDAGPSFVKNPALWEVDVPQPPDSVLQAAQRVAAAAEPSAAVSVSSPSRAPKVSVATDDDASYAASFAASPPDAGIMSPLCSAPRTARSTRTADAASDLRDGVEGLHLDAGEEAALSGVRVERQLRF